MPATLNNAPTVDTYTDATTVIFTAPRPAFSLNVVNAGVFYLLYYTPPGQLHNRDRQPDPTGEHFLPPSLNRFRDAHAEGLPQGAMFGAIAVRSAVAGTPAQVSVM